MIDTIRVRHNLCLSQEAVKRLNDRDLPHWSAVSMQKTRGDGRSLFSETSSTSFTHDGSGLRVNASEYDKHSAEVSLPRLLHGDNGMLLKSPDEFRAAIDCLIGLLRVFHPSIEPAHLELHRIDLSLNLTVDPTVILPLHRHARHPRIRREVEEYHNPDSNRRRPEPHSVFQLNTVRLAGTKTTICLYDKSAERMARRRRASHLIDTPLPRCLRVEIQLRGRRHVSTLLGGLEIDALTLDRLDFGACYRAFRNIMVEFDPVGYFPRFEANLPNLLAILLLHPETQASLGGINPLEWYRLVNQVNDRQFREMRRRVHQAELLLSEFRWSDVLPEAFLPDVIEILPDGRLIRHLGSGLMPPLPPAPPPPVPLSFPPLLLG
ncbi:MAG: hypothetical protein JNK37_05245 [Verrucomicrobiales bacterium]|nr:hypothetical protein [Verrucomicrobiales bacterium]